MDIDAAAPADAHAAVSEAAATEVLAVVRETTKSYPVACSLSFVSPTPIFSSFRLRHII